MNNGSSPRIRDAIVSVFIPYWPDNPYQVELAKSLEFHHIRVEKGVRLRTLFIRSILWHSKPDILHLHWLHYLLQRSSTAKSLAKTFRFIIGLIIFKLMGVKLVWTAHNLKNHENQNLIVDRTCTWVVAKLANVIIAHSISAKSEVIRTFNLKNESKVFVVPHGNYIDCYENKIKRAEARKILGVPSSATVLLFLGNIRPYKGVLDLIESFKRLGKNNAHLVIAGRVFNKELTDLIAEKIAGHDNINFYPGFVADDRIQVYMQACDIVTLPYKEGLTSGAAILAMSFGKACIAPRTTCFKEILDEKGSFLYDSDDNDGLLKGMNLALLRKSKLVVMGKYNFEVAKEWDWNKIGQMTAGTYVQCLRR